MSITWQVVKTVSKLRPDWRASVKQFENFHKREHYYSPIPLISQVRRDEERIFDHRERSLRGIDLNVDGQLRLLEAISNFYSELPFSEKKSLNLRYHLDNKYYPYMDGILYYGLLRHLKPKRIIEIGSGYSSAACLDVSERFFGTSIRCTFVEPDPVRLDQLLTSDDWRVTEVRKCMVQDVPLDEFRGLEPNDILFVDSSHVSKVGSDVNHILFEILPRLRTGVFVHFHDIFYPFEYPKSWIYRGVAWNEAYLLRAFLQNNSDYQIAIWSDFLARFHADAVQTAMPLCKKNSGSFWLCKK